MKKNKIILASSIVLISFLLIYNNSETDKKEKELVKEPLPSKVTLDTPDIKISKIQKKTINVNPPKLKETSKYKLSVLPQNIKVKEKKQRFKELIIPTIEKTYASLQKQYNETEASLQSKKDNEKIQSLMRIYNAKSSKELLERLKPHPQSIAIAQAAMQSGWATSRFTLIANNLFGIWSFDENEPRVQANETRDGKAIYLKKYDSLQESVQDYYKLLATSPLFAEFREQKMKTDDPYLLIQALDKYYKKGDNFTEGLKQLIKYNKFNQYDNKEKKNSK